jgi:squalene cyclase
MEHLQRRAERDLRVGQSYFALKLAGHSPSAPHMQEARACVLRLGGIPRMNTYAKLYLALLGQFPWKYLPTVPVEIIFFPRWLFFNCLGDVVMESRHAHSAGDPQPLQTDASPSGESAAARAVSHRH